MEDSYTVKKISRMAQVIDDYTTEARKKNLIYAFGDANITEVQKKLRAHKKKNRRIYKFYCIPHNCFCKSCCKTQISVQYLQKEKKEILYFR